MPCKCFAYQMAQNEYSDAGKCVFVKKDFECPLCHNKSKSYRTHIDGDYQGSVFECTKCHEYVKYYLDSSLECWKEEFFIFNDNRSKAIIFDYIDNECTIVGNTSSGIDIPIFKFSSREQLVNKAKLYITFS